MSAAASTLSPNVYLDSCLAPFAAFLTRPEVTDIYVNQPGELWIETLGGMTEHHAAPNLSTSILARLARQIAAINAQGISREHPLLAAKLPDGSRVQIVLPPATRGTIAMAIRKHVAGSLSLADYARSGAFARTQIGSAGVEVLVTEHASSSDAAMPLLQKAVRARRNVLISGGTSSGKTTFLNALLGEVPTDERLILIEDTAELQLTHANSVGLVAARGGEGEARVTAEDLLIASLRMRPDRIILGEMRGPEAMTFLRAVNTGHPGSMSTIHADSPERAIDQLALLVLQTGVRMHWDDVVRYVTRSLDFIVQLRREGGRRSVERIHQVLR